MSTRYHVETLGNSGYWSPCKKSKNGFWHVVWAYTEFVSPKQAKEFMEDVVIFCVRERIGVVKARVITNQGKTYCSVQV